MAETIDVVVVGGGYAGVMAANRLTQRDDVTVTLINPRPDFVHRIRLHQLVSGTGVAVVAYRDVLADSVRLVVETASRIDTAERTVSFTNGDAVAYDYLIYAVGSGSAVRACPGPPSTPTPWQAWRRRSGYGRCLTSRPRRKW